MTIDIMAQSKRLFAKALVKLIVVAVQCYLSEAAAVLRLSDLELQIAHLRLHRVCIQHSPLFMFRFEK